MADSENVEETQRQYMVEEAWRNEANEKSLDRGNLPDVIDSDVDDFLQEQQSLVSAAWKQVEADEKLWQENVLTGERENGHASNTSRDVPLVVIGGSGLLESEMFANASVEIIEGVKVRRSSGNVCFISRHTANLEEEYRQPHQIDHKMIWKVISKLQPNAVLGVCSVGSLHPASIPMGSLMCASDWIHATFTPVHFFDDPRAHVKPILDESKRALVLQAIHQETSLNEYLINPSTEIVYCQTRGPRFETKAEVRMIKQFADVVGMTAGDEASMACELGIPYVMLCFVDNVAHGLSADGDKNIENISAFRKAQKANLDRVELATRIAIQSLSGPSASPIASNPSPFDVDTLIQARFVNTVDINDTLINHGVVAVRDGCIVGVHKAGEAPPYRSRQVFSFPDSMAMPGLVNAHTHAAMALMRGFGDDLQLTDWLVTKIWPAEAKCVSREYVRDGTILAIEEMLASGTTTFNDVYFFPDVIENVCLEMGIRAVVGLVVIEFPSAMAKDGDDYMRLIRERLNKLDESKDEKSLVTFAVTPHAPYSVSEQHIVEAKALAAKHGCVFHTHLHECEEEIRASVALDKKSGFCHRCEIACRPLDNLERIGVLDGSCSFAHMTQLEDSEMDLIAARGCHVVHCPSSNMKLASGFCQVAKLLEKGVNVALGTDGAASNNSLDMFGEIKMAALLGKGVAKSATAVNAKQAVRMGTINGAKALNLDRVCGSLEVGKRADIIIVDLLNRNESRPVYDPVSSFVYSASRNQVRSVWVDGQAKIQEGRRVILSDYSTEAELRKCAERWQEKMEGVVRELAEI